MKKIILFVILALTTLSIQAQTVILDSNGVTIKYIGESTTFRIPLVQFVQASPRGTLEWFAIVDDNTKSYINGYAVSSPSCITYFTPPGNSTPIPFNNIVTTLVTDMRDMFVGARDFNQNIGSWDVSNVTDMNSIFREASVFNQPIGSWDVSKVTDMNLMFFQAYAFNQPIGTWNVTNVTNMEGMFVGAFAFDQPIDSWDVSQVTRMTGMFLQAYAFNQPIGSWNVSNVTDMSDMFNGAKLSTANYDATLIGWSTRGANGSFLTQGVIFDGGNSNYCNSSSSRDYLINRFGWVIIDGGVNCASLGTEVFDRISVSLYPNPTSSVLTINTNANIANQPYTISDALGKIVLKGKLNEGDNSINVEQLSKGIYYLKVSDNKASKFIKE